MSVSSSNPTEWFVETKLNPPFVRSDIIRRPNLEEMLYRSVSVLPLTLLSAPAGYGKTTLLATLPLLLPDHSLAWITLDTEDNDPVRFIGLLVSALQRLHRDCGQGVWSLISGGVLSGSDVKRAMGYLINDIIHYLPEHFILVLDDLHFVVEPMVHVALDYLLEHAPQNIHVAIGTRHDPPLRLTRLAVRRQMGELRRAELSLNQDESYQLLNDTLGLSLSADEVAVLQERTEGWPGALCLLAGPLRHLVTPSDRIQFMAALIHTERQALEFLAEEILRYLPEDIRRFLMQTAILAEITPTACQAVTGRQDAEEVLAELYQRNLAIASLAATADGEPVYRYHALFARLLILQLERELPGEIVELHRRAAAVQKTPGRAISHYMSARLWDQAAQLMIKWGMELLHRGMAETIRQWYSALPWETREQGNKGEATSALERAVKLEVQLPMAQVGGSARMLQARLLLEQGLSDAALATARPVLTKWLQASTPGYALLDGAAILPVISLAAEHNEYYATRLLQLFPKPDHKVGLLSHLPVDTLVMGNLLEPLTTRECDVLKLLAAGRSNQQISAELHISKETVKSHVTHIFRKLDVHSRTQAAARARELGL